MTEFVLEYHVSALRGKVEDVPTADGVDLEDIRRSDPDAMFVSLPIAELGAISENGLLYDDDLLSTLEEQINADRPGGIFGHLKEEDRSTAFPLPAGFWVGAKRFGSTLWAKSYIPPGAARDYVRNLKQVGGELGTSIYGKVAKFEKTLEGAKRAIGFKLESLDFAPPSRAALRMGAIPHLTTEMNTQEATMPEKTASELIQELRAVEVPPQKGWTVPAAAKQEVAELADIRQTLGADETADLKQLVSELLQEREEARQAAVKVRISELVNEGIKLEDARDLVTEYIEARRPKTVQEAEHAYAQVIEMPSVKKVLALTVQSLSGPSAIVNGKVRETGRPKLDDTPENRQRAAAAMGINI